MIVLVLLLALALVGVGVVLGSLILSDRAHDRGVWLDTRENQLNHLWRSLQAAQRINLAFWQAREAMRQEAKRADPRPR